MLLQGWPDAFAFHSIVKYQLGILCKIWGSTFSRGLRCLKTWDQLHVIRRISKGGITYLLFRQMSNISLEFYAKFEGQRFLETGDVSRPGTNSMSLGGSTRVAWRICFSFKWQRLMRTFGYWVSSYATAVHICFARNLACVACPIIFSNAGNVKTW